MGTYFALMNEAAKRGEEYEVLEQIPEILKKLETGGAEPIEIAKVIKVLTEFEGRIAALVNQTTPVMERTNRAQKALARLQALKEAIQSAATLSSSAAHR